MSPRSTPQASPWRWRQRARSRPRWCSSSRSATPACAPATASASASRGGRACWSRRPAARSPGRRRAGASWAASRSRRAAAPSRCRRAPRRSPSPSTAQARCTSCARPDAFPRSRRRPPRRSGSPCSAGTARCSRPAGAGSRCAPGSPGVLPLLSAHPEGLSAESLCAHLHGDGGSPSSVRVEVSRLRKVLGPGALDTDHYRLTCALESDARSVECLLQRGAVREAAEAYTGPLLPDSEAPGVVEERERLESWLHQAVMTADDVEALWAWVLTAHGTEDLPAWK